MLRLPYPALAGVAAGVLGGAAAAIESRYSPFQMSPSRYLWPAAFGLLSLLCVRWMPRAASPPRWSPLAVLAAIVVLCLLIGWVTLVAWPNSGDEYGDLYLARTFLAGRLWNAPPPIRDLFDTFQIRTISGKTFAYYAPGWPAVIAVFEAVHLPELAGPAMTAVLGVALIRAMRALGMSAEWQAFGVATILFSPFVLFNGASLYPHMASAAAVGLIIWTRLSVERAPAWWKEVLVGFLFSALLQIRYDAFLVVFVLYMIDRVWRQRLGVVREFALAAVGAIPLLLCFFAYNQALTGDALLTGYNWANPHYRLGLWGVGDDGPHSPERALLHTAIWSGELVEFAGLALIPSYALALAAKWRAGRLRFFDVMLPAVVLFYVLQPDNGGHRYGPRYWFYGWPPVILTVLSGLGPQLRLRFARFGSVNLAFCAGALLVLGVLNRSYIDGRRALYTTQPPSEPAVVLVPNRSFFISPWQTIPSHVYASDLIRNDLDLRGKVLYANGTMPDSVTLACKLPGRTVYRWQAGGTYLRVPCP